jgi:hypothetical protein
LQLKISIWRLVESHFAVVGFLQIKSSLGFADFMYFLPVQAAFESMAPSHRRAVCESLMRGGAQMSWG